jgi:glycosyltransferase involved in cell wall biosynthesis
MVHGLPVIASIGDGTEADLVTPEVGILDEELDVDRLAGHLRTLRGSPRLRARLSAGAERRVRDGANIENFVDRIRDAVRRAYVERYGSP